MTLRLLDASATQAALPWQPLVEAVEQAIAAHRAGRVQVPERSVHAIAADTRWFVMPAWTAPDAGGLAIAKLITWNPNNPARGLAAILGDVLVLRTETGESLLLLDGPTVTARRTAAVTAVAARALGAVRGGPLLLFGAGAQARAHLMCLHETLDVREVWLRSRGAEGAARLAAEARALGISVRPADDLGEALARCPLVVAATPAGEICLDRLPREDAFVAAVGAFTPAMAEVGAEVVRHIARHGRLLLDTASARHEGGDLLQAGLDLAAVPVLGDALPAAGGPAMFKSCGSALWDLAAAACAVGRSAAPAKAPV